MASFTLRFPIYLDPISLAARFQRIGIILSHQASTRRRFDVDTTSCAYWEARILLLIFLLLIHP